MTDALDAELCKLQGLVGDAPSRWPSISHSLDSTVQMLRRSQALLASGVPPRTVAGDITFALDERKKTIDERQKEIYNSSSRVGKILDKKFPAGTGPNMDISPFMDEESRTALENVISVHFLRTGQFESARVFSGESRGAAPWHLQAQMVALHEILSDLRGGNIGTAIAWAEQHRPMLQKRSSSLEFNLHKLHYLRLISTPHPDASLEAVSYLRSLDQELVVLHAQEISRLITAVIYLPSERLRSSPYSDLLNPDLYRNVETEFIREYCSSVGQSRSLPLRISGDIGAGGALQRIEKGRRVMSEKKRDWNQYEELPVEIPIPSEHRFHSIFACMVSKEQSTEENPPMMIPCGHVLAKDSLASMTKPNGRLKCPYCPAETNASSAFRVYF